MKVTLTALIAAFFLVVGLPFAALGGPAGGAITDTDGDGVEDSFDNCTSLANAEQKDFDHDGCGDLCDPDIDQDGSVGSTDFLAWKASFETQEGDACFDFRVDFDCDGSVGSTDFLIWKAKFEGPPGPSGLDCSQRDPVACDNPDCP